MVEDLRSKFELLEYYFSHHAVDQALARRIFRIEIEEAVRCGQIIEDYPDHKYGPSCLIFGRTSDSRPVHVQCTAPGHGKVKIITVYEPDPVEGIDFRTRRLT